MAREMDTEQVVNVMNGLIDHNFQFITISGGEPTLRTDLIDILKNVRKKEHTMVGLFTNGYGITDNNIIILKDYIDQFIISIDGCEENHNELRGIQNYHTVLDVLKIFKAYAIPFSIQMMVSNYNWQDLDHVVDLAIKYNAFGIKFSHIGPQGVALRHPDLFINMEQKSKLFKYIEQVRQKTNLVVEHNFILNEVFAKYKESFFKIYMNITPNGFILPYYGLMKFNLGNILKKDWSLDLQQIVNLSAVARKNINAFYDILCKTYTECKRYFNLGNIVIPYEEILLKNSM